MKNNATANGDPREGVWYWVYLKPHWQLVVEFSDTTTHPNLWQKKVTPAIAKHYKLKKEAAAILAHLHYAMPRGRVVLWEDGKAYVGHGSDSPRSLRSSALKTIISTFGLSRLMVVGRVVVTAEDHEKMDRRQKTEIQKLIGKVPY